MSTSPAISRLPPLPALRDFIHMYKLQAKKILSQNYLMDMNITRKIVRHAKVRENDWVVEIGPGPGGITRGILESGCGRLDVVEIDRRFIPPLEYVAEAAGEGRLNIHHENALKCDVGEFWQNEEHRPPSIPWKNANLPNMHIIGNLPFNIASPLVIKYLKAMSYRREIWKYGRVPLTLTFQLEVAKRICSPIACSTRSRISIMSQYISEPEIVFKIPGSCFVPSPDVDVGVVRFVPRKTPLIKAPFEIIEKMCRQVFHYRQKFMIKGLKTLYPKELEMELSHELLKSCRIDPTMTSISLGIEQFADLSEGYYEQCKRIPGLFHYDYTRPKITIENLSQKPMPEMIEFLDEKEQENNVEAEKWSLKDFTVS